VYVISVVSTQLLGYELSNSSRRRLLDRPSDQDVWEMGWYPAYSWQS
jgi:hypothetical protein